MPDRRASAVERPARRRDVFQTETPGGCSGNGLLGPGRRETSAQEPLISSEMVAEMPLAGLSLENPFKSPPGHEDSLTRPRLGSGAGSGTIASDVLSYSACLTRIVHRRIFDADGTPFCLEALMASVSLHDLGIDRLSIEERLQVAEAIWDSVVHDVETAPLPDWQKAELERRLADSVANPDAVRPWADVEAEALARAK